MGTSKPQAPAGVAAELVMLAAPQSAAAEAYRTLRTNVQFAAIDEPVRTILVTSAGADGGAAVVAANLAAACSQDGKRVALVDADLRRPSLHGLLGLTGERGLTDAVLAGQVESPPLVSAGSEGLWLLPAGTPPPNPTELLGSQRMRRLVAALSEQHDLVVLSAPPVTSVADATVLAPLVDGVVMVISAGKTRRDNALRAKEQLEHVRARILGVVLYGGRRGERSARTYLAGADAG